MESKKFKSLLHQIWDSIVEFPARLGGNKITKSALDQAKKLGYASMALQQKHIDLIYQQLAEVSDASEENLDVQQMVKRTPRHNKNDVTAFHLSKNYSELTNDIFNLDSERKYKREIQRFIKTLSEDVDRSHGVWYLSKDGKRAFRINTSVKNFDENKGETTYGFEVVDWYNLENLNNEQLNIIENEYKENDRAIGGLLTQYESEQGSMHNSDILLPDGEANWDNDGLDQETP